MPAELVFILVRPARGGNVAAACRALKNMGFDDLRLVAPVPDLAQPAERAAAYGAWDVLDGVSVCADLAAAVADAHWVVGTSGKTSPRSLTPRELASALDAGPPRRVALVFGPEASGLSERELELCHARLHIPTSPAQPSLNLAQAVLIVAYEAFLAGLARAAPRPPAGPRAAQDRGQARAVSTVGETEAALAALREALLEVGFLDPQNPGRVLAELRRLLARAAPTSRELTLLRGLARQIEWAGRVARARRGSR